MFFNYWVGGGIKTKLSEVVVIKTLPFCLIYKMKKVRFAYEVEDISTESLSVSDELIEMYKGESPPKRCRGGLTVKLLDSV